jgi:uncharacterized phage infection (PIP) family protein YhgE
MGNIDGLKEQVEEFKQRLNDPESQKTAKPDELKARLASIKASLETKQVEIDQLSAENKQFVAENKQLAAENKQLAAEKQQLSAENEQLRKLLKEVLSALDNQPADAATNILCEFLAETDPLIKPKGDRSETVIAAGPPGDLATAGPAKAEKAESGPPVAAGEEVDEEESPALRRIMKRGRRAVG